MQVEVIVHACTNDVAVDGIASNSRLSQAHDSAISHIRNSIRTRHPDIILCLDYFGALLLQISH
jgi:hypothetical protein